MPKYIVTTMIQSADIDNNEPVQVRWYTGDSLAQAIAAMTSAAAHHEEVTENTGIPASARYNTIGVTLSIEQTPVEESVRGCSCGMADYGAPGHDGHEEFDPDIEAEFADDVDPDVPSATPSTVRAFDTETVAYSLSDCAYWNTPGEECAGPRVGVVIATDDILCEKHFNHPPQ